MRNATDVARAVVARQGIDLDEVLAQAGSEPVMDPRGWIHPDPVAHRMEALGERLAHEFEGTFADAHVDHSGIALWVRRNQARGDGGGPAKPWLTLRGLAGRGKTHQMYGAVRAMATAAAQANRTYRWRIITHPELNRRLRPQPDNSHLPLIDFYSDLDLLGWDDFGAGSFKDYAIETTLELLDRRYRRNLPTIFTTNLNWEDMGERLSGRVPSRLQEGTVIDLKGPDRRLTLGERL
ncbi:ATP-binding protein [Micromonospora sp. C51]|uniref:ATP-binding protein n=1 Tax=Micromonospora sp. C51 TaxID=2824879 RepID=UPI001B36E54B|nr:ATP-binding protein [Micromonospora sp. C51]MBQ1047798.1 ATP-binding protein [Micromonospora sp. C51]